MDESPNPQCIQPDAPWAACVICGKPVKTCEHTEPVGAANDYTCPAHPDGYEFSEGRWVCSGDCYDKAVELLT